MDPDTLKVKELEDWLKAFPSEHVTIHFSGKHSDPLASALLAELSLTALEHCSMLSVSTIGLGLSRELALLPVDRWIVSLPAATEDSWRAVRGDERFSEAILAINCLLKLSPAMLEVVLTLWKPSEDDEEHFRALSKALGWKHMQTVFGRFDPTGRHIGRAENLAMGHPLSPYEPGDGGVPVLRHEPGGCPLAGCLFLDAAGSLRPCPFVDDDGPAETGPSPGAWTRAAAWTALKRDRTFQACRWCPGTHLKSSS